jgi:hypothetical protein
MRWKQRWYEGMKEWVYSYEQVLSAGMIALAVILVSYLFDEGGMMMVVIVCGVGLLVLVIAGLLKSRMVFNDDAVVVERRLLGRTINRRVYRYTDIYKFILAKNYGVIQVKKYRLYADMADKIVRITAERRYYDCIKIMEQIKGRAGKLIYDATDEYYRSEDDMFRAYYKMKRMVEEVKKEPGEK